MITENNLINAGFSREVINGSIVFTRQGFSILRNDLGWCPCTMLFGQPFIGDIYLSTMEELERFIVESINV
jgi:hypothetical protein